MLPCCTILSEDAASHQWGKVLGSQPETEICRDCQVLFVIRRKQGLQTFKLCRKNLFYVAWFHCINAATSDCSLSVPVAWSRPWNLRSCCSWVGPLDSTTSKKNCRIVCALACCPALRSRSKPCGHFAAHLRGALHPICAAYWSSSYYMSAAQQRVSLDARTLRRTWRHQILYPTRLRTMKNKATGLEALLPIKLMSKVLIAVVPPPAQR